MAKELPPAQFSFKSPGEQAENQMTILREELETRKKGTLQEKEDWWHLCYDTLEKRFFIEHRWDYVSLNSLNQNTGTMELNIEDCPGHLSVKIDELKDKLLIRAEHAVDNEID